MQRALCFAMIGCSLIGNAQTTVPEWQRAATQKYPELAVPGSPFNQFFLQRHKERENSSPGFFQQPGWPMVLADEVAKRLPPPLPLKPDDPILNQAEQAYIAAVKIYRSPTATNKELQEAIFLYHRSASCGNALAMLDLARIFQGVEDQATIEALYQRAAELGHPDGLLHTASKASTLEEYVGLLTRAACVGSMKAVYDLAEFYGGVNSRSGNDANPDLATAMMWRAVYDFLNGSKSKETEALEKLLSVAQIQASSEVATRFIDSYQLTKGQSFEVRSKQMYFVGFLKKETPLLADIAKFAAQVAPDVAQHPPRTIPLPNQADSAQPTIQRSAATTGSRRIVLSANWASRTGSSSGGGSQTLMDLAQLLSGYGQPDNSLPPHPADAVHFFDGIQYLMPYEEGRKALDLSQKSLSTTKIACPGFPEGVAYHSFDGAFSGNYNRLYVVTDVRNQIVSLQFVDEAPKQTSYEGRDNNWHTYNFINARTKATRSLRIYYKTKREGSSAVRIETILYDPRSKKCLERTLWYAPIPFVDILLYCARQQLNN
jgi:TPR repeat protein